MVFCVNWFTLNLIKYVINIINIDCKQEADSSPGGLDIDKPDKCEHTIDVSSSNVQEISVR
jgi:hypothetical protein